MTNAHEHGKASPTRKQSKLGHESGNEGEGSRTAAKDYNERTGKFIRSGRVAASAKEAERAMEGKERSELEKAETFGKRHARY